MGVQKSPYPMQRNRQLTPKQAAFVEYFVETNNVEESATRAGYVNSSHNNISKTVRSLMNHPGVLAEIQRRRDEVFGTNTATAAEVMDFLTRTMRGEIKDQFGLDAPLSDRINAAKEIAKRTIDIDNRLASRQADANTVKLVIERKTHLKTAGEATEETE